VGIGVKRAEGMKPRRKVTRRKVTSGAMPTVVAGGRGRAFAVPEHVEREREIARRLEALPGELLDATPDDGRERRRRAPDLGRQLGQVVAHDRGHGVGGEPRLKGGCPVSISYKHAAEREEVGAMVDRLAAHLLGRHVADRAITRPYSVMVGSSESCGVAPPIPSA